MNKKTSALNLSQKLTSSQGGWASGPSLGLTSLGLERSYQRLFSVIKKTPLNKRNLTGQAKFVISKYSFSKFVLFVLLVAGVLGFGGSARAQVCEANNNCYYVAPDGDDSNNGSFESPWASPAKAWYTADAGDIVYFRGGNYTISTEIDTKFIGHDGTESNPITFRNYPDESVTFNCGIVDPVFDIERDWNVVKNINFNGGRTVFSLGKNRHAHNFKIEYCTAQMALSTDNHGFVIGRSNSEDVTVQNCIIRGPGAGANTNVSGLIIFGAPGFKALHNEIYDVPRGIYYKHGDSLPDYDTGIEIAYNYVHDTGHQGMFFNCSYASIHDNLFGLNNGYVNFNSANGGSNGEYNNFYHNTIYNKAITIDEDLGNGKHNTIKDNIFMSICNIYKYSSEAHYTAMDYNLYVSGNAIVENKINYDLAAWQSYYGQDTHSLSGTPTFVGGVSPSSISDFALAAGSLGKNAASDGKDMGADISLVGIQSGSDLTPPSRSNPQPTGTLSSGTTSTTISLDTDETAICKYSTNSGTNYDLMTLQLSSGQANTHTDTVSDLEDGNSYTYYIRCQDESGNQNPDDFEISFSVATHTIYSISNFINLVTDWLKSESGLESDVNGDGVVNTRDLGIMMSNWQ